MSPFDKSQPTATRQRNIVSFQRQDIDAEGGEANAPAKVRYNIMPAPEGTCPQCAVRHDPAQPHNAQSLHYQYTFYSEHSRWPNWVDAMAHCSDEVRETWKAELLRIGVDVDAGHLSPKSEAE